jgi:LysM repeat protein
LNSDQPSSNEAGSAENPAANAETKRKASSSTRSDRLILWGAWLIALSLALAASYLGWYTQRAAAAPGEAGTPTAMPTSIPTEISAPGENNPLVMPALPEAFSLQAIARYASLHTIIPTRPRQNVTDYTVELGDSVFGIAKKFNIKPETILMSNTDQLNDNPNDLSVGMVLKILPTNGIYYQWKEGDSFEAVAREFRTTVDEIINWMGNKLDLANPQVAAGQWLVLPGGERDLNPWIVPIPAVGRAGVVKKLPGGCNLDSVGVYGTGAFVWPAANHFLSGNDYWSGHLGIDIAGGIGDPVYAADSGTVLMGGWSSGGYGNVIILDHGNGYVTVYAHLSVISTYCGAVVNRGAYIGAVGSTGNSTGSHLHFEVRLNGGFVNPWYVLPPP